MNYTQNERIAQVGDNTLVVGIDIGSDKHYARAFTERGMEISRKAFVFENTESGFGQLDVWMEKLAGENGKAKIMVEMCIRDRILKRGQTGQYARNCLRFTGALFGSTMP